MPETARKPQTINEKPKNPLIFAHLKNGTAKSVQAKTKNHEKRNSPRNVQNSCF